MKTTTAADVDAFLRRADERAYPEPRPRGRRQTAATRRRLKAVHVERQRELAAADPDASPLRRRRLAAGLSWPDLAERAGVSVTSVARAEGRPEKVGPWTWLRLARALNVAPEELRPDGPPPAAD